MKEPLPNFEITCDDDYIVRWNTRDWNLIHRIQEYFGQRRHTTVNMIAKFTISRDDPRYKTFLEGEQMGFYTISGKKSQ